MRQQFWGGTISHFFPPKNILIVFAVVVVEARSRNLWMFLDIRFFCFVGYWLHDLIKAATK